MKGEAVCKARFQGGTNTHTQVDQGFDSRPAAAEHQGETRRPGDISVHPIMKRLPGEAGPRSLDCAEKRRGGVSLQGERPGWDP